MHGRDCRGHRRCRHRSRSLIRTNSGGGGNAASVPSFKVSHSHARRSRHRHQFIDHLHEGHRLRWAGPCRGRGPCRRSAANPKPGWFEQEVADWTGAATKALKQLTKKIDAKRVAGISISNQRESYAQFDAKDKPLRPGTLWLDERAHREVAEIVAELGRDRIHKISGKPPDVTPCLYRCRWFSKHMPKMWEKTAKTAEVHGVITHFLTGRWATSTASADPMGLLDVSAYDWSDALLKAARLTREQLPLLYRPGEIMGEVSAAAAKLTGLKAGIPVIAGGGDGQCAGTGANIFLQAAPM